MYIFASDTNYSALRLRQRPANEKKSLNFFWKLLTLLTKNFIIYKANCAGDRAV